MPSLLQATEPGAGAGFNEGLPQLLPWVRRARPILGTIVEISVHDQRREPRLQAAIDQAFACIECVHALMSFQGPDSELSRLNRDAIRRPQRVDAHTYNVFAAALHIAALSGGAFDPCVASRLQGWGLLPHNQLPVNPLGNWRDIEMLPGRRIRYAKAVRVDLGGIAKGYAVDLAVRSLIGFGIENIVVNAGGDLRVAGPRSHSVRLRHPSAPLCSAHTVSLHNAALATSADYFSRRAGAAGEVSALVNPRDGTPYLGGRSISVRTVDCVTADALTKVVMFAPAGNARAVLAHFEGDAFVI